MVYKLRSGKEPMVASKKRKKGESSTAKTTEDLTVTPPASNQPVRTTGVELSKDEGVAVHVSEDANVFSDPSDTDSDADSDTYICNQYDMAISILKKEKAEMEEELKYMKEVVRAWELKLAQEEAEHRMLVQFVKDVVNWGGGR